MTDAKSAWHDASERFGSLGTKLKGHYEEQRGQEADQAKAEVKDALHRLSGALEDAFEALGKAARDDAVKTDVKQVGQSLATALGATFTEVSAELQRAFASRSGGSGGSGSSGPAKTSAPAEGVVADEVVAEEVVTGEPEPATPDADATAAPDADADADATAAPDADKGEQEPPRVEPWGTP